MPKVVAFDVVETLFSIDALKTLAGEFGLPPSALCLWLSRIARDGACLSLSDTYKTYTEVSRAALLQVAASSGVALSCEDVQELISGFKRLRPHADVFFTLKALQDQKIRVVMLTNESAELTKHLLVEHDLDAFVHKIISVDEVRVWKPCCKVYQHAARLLAVPANEMAMVSAHAWDIQGAKAAGLIGAWVSPSEKAYAQTFLAPDFTGQSVNELCMKMITPPATMPVSEEMTPKIA